MWCHRMAPVSWVSLSWCGSWGVARCHCHCTAPGVVHTVTMTALSHSCHAVLPCSPAVLHSATVAPWGVTGCHCHHAAHRVSLSPQGCRLPRSVTAAPVGCHTESSSVPSAWDVTQCYVTAWPTGCHPVSPSLPSCSISPSVAVTAWPTGCHPVSPSLHGLGCRTPSLCRIPHSACPMGCHPAPPCILGCVTPHPHRPRGTLGTAQQLPAAQVPATQRPPGGNSSPSPSPLPTHSHGRLQLPGEQPFPITHKPGSN